MACIFIESFDIEASVAADKGWNQNIPGTVSSGNGRTGKGLGGQNAGWWRNLPGNYSTLIVGMAIKVDDWNHHIFQFLESGSYQCSIRIDSTGHYNVVTGQNSTVLATSSVIAALGTWHYLEAKITFHNTTGSIELRLDENVVATATNVNTRAGTTNAYANRIQLGYEGTANGITYWDDMYIFDNSGSTNNDFIGDIQIEFGTPNGLGAYGDFSANTGTTFGAVDEIPQNGDTDYIAGNTVGNKSTFTTSDITTTAGTIYAVQTTAVVRKDVAGPRTLASLLRLSGTDVNGTTTSLLNTYAAILDVFETKPGGGSWSVADVNSLEAGVEIKS